MVSLSRLSAAAALAAAVTAGAGARADDLVSAETAAAYEHVSCVGAPNELRIVVTNVKRGEGLVTADLYRNDEQGFLNKKGRVNRARFAARAPYTIFCLTAPAAGADGFLQGARSAYEMILMAFESGDRETLRQMAIRALADYAPVSREAVPALIALIGERDERAGTGAVAKVAAPRYSSFSFT